jgi:PLP dependent protein
MTYVSRIRSALPEIRERMARAAERSGRGPHSVRLITVTKSHPIEAAAAAVECGLLELGENRAEELEWKTDALDAPGLQWHMIGHVQGRKVNKLVGRADLVHSIDSVRIAERFSRVVVESHTNVEVLVQVNVSGEEAKSGLDADRALDEVLGICALPGMIVRGLMTMAPFVRDESVVRGAFCGLRRIHERLLGHDEYEGTELSMGMTNDFEVAIEEGSTMIRVGTALLGPRPENKESRRPTE